MRVMLAGPAGNYVVWRGPSRRAGLLHPDPERPFHLWKRRLIVLGALSGRLHANRPPPPGLFGWTNISGWSGRTDGFGAAYRGVIKDFVTKSSITWPGTLGFELFDD